MEYILCDQGFSGCLLGGINSSEQEENHIVNLYEA